MNNFISQQRSDYIYGWKDLAKYFEVHPRTLFRWHKLNPIPWEKRGPKKQHSVRISLESASQYYSNFYSK